MVTESRAGFGQSQGNGDSLVMIGDRVRQGLTLRGVQWAMLLHAFSLISFGNSDVFADDSSEHGRPWNRHVIDDRFDGPDGTKLGDINGDGLLDVVTGWESEGLTVVYFHPGYRYVRRSWPSVVVGPTLKAEDAVFVDLNQDGVLDVVSSTEKRSERILIHWAPSDKGKLLIPQEWKQQSIASVAGVSQWMFAEPIALPSVSSRPSLVIGGKNYNHDQTAVLGILTPSKTDKQGEFDWHPLASVSWTMSIIIRDVDGDGDQDIIYSDKHGPGVGVWWLQNPGSTNQLDKWTKHKITDQLDSATLIATGDVDGDGLEDIVAPVDLLPEGNQPKNRAIRILWRKNPSGLDWDRTDILTPPRTGQPKAATTGDVNGDGKVDIVVASSGATDGQMGTYWLEYQSSPKDAHWIVHRIADPAGIKYDLVHLIDIDGDGDLDVLTNEEKEDEKGLGVFWYENPRIN
jgi:hypothetical protein